MRNITCIGACLALALSVGAQNTIVGWEAYVDVDGGPGTGTWYPLAPNDTVNFLDQLDASTMSVGYHRVCVRMKASNGLWSSPRASLVYIQPSVAGPVFHEVIACEYFVGTDPGAGDGISIPLDSAASEVYLERELDLLSLGLPLGDYDISIRYKSSAGHWSMIERRPFTVCESWGALAGFDHVRVGPHFSFMDTSVYATSYLWDFGDGATDTVSNPAHTYAEPGLYAVSQTVSNACATTTATVDVLNSALESYAPHIGGDSSYVTIMFYGAFADSVVVTMSLGGDQIVAPDSMVTMYDYTRFAATFDLTGRPHGLWDVQIESVGDTLMLVPEGFEITDAVYGAEASLLLPTTARLGSKRTGQIQWSNMGNIDVNAGVVSMWSVNSTPFGYVNEPLLDSLHILALTLSNDGDTTIAAGQSGVASFRYKMEGNVSIGAILDSRNNTWPFQNPGCFGEPPQGDFCSCVPDLWFQLPCQQHDICYYTAGGPSKEVCDRQFFDNMYQTCFSSNVPLADLNACIRQAHNYYAGVRTLGWLVGAFEEARENPVAAQDVILWDGSVYPALGQCGPDVLCFQIDAFGSYDPNNKLGPSGYGLPNWTKQQVYPYTINFENVDTATASVATAVITDTIDSSVFDLSSLQLASIVIGDSVYPLPPHRQEYTMEIDLTSEHDVFLRVNVRFNATNGLLKWQFLALDPESGEVVDDLRGFLPPNVDSPEGQASVSYTVLAKDSLPHGTELRNNASIVFDTNEPIVTNEWLNTLDLIPPTSSVAPLPALSVDSIVVSWNGSDAGAGIDRWDVFVAVNGSSTYEPWLVNYTGNGATFFGAEDSTYHFYSIAIDGVGNREVKSPTSEASSYLDFSTAVEAIIDQGAFDLFPNPTIGGITLVGSTEVPCMLQVEVRNTVGQLLEQRSFPTGTGAVRVSLDLPKLAVGTYIATIKCEDVKLVERLIKISE